MSEIRPPGGRLRPVCGGGGLEGGSWLSSRLVRLRQGVHGQTEGQAQALRQGSAEARTGVCDGIQEEEDLRGGWERARHPWEMPRPVACLVFIWAQEARAPGEQQGVGWALGTPTKEQQAREAQRCRGRFLHSIWASCFEAVACLLSERKSFPSPYPAPTILPPSSYHHAPSPHRQAPSRVSCCTKLHLRRQGGPSKGPLLRCTVLRCAALFCVFAIAQRSAGVKAVLDLGTADIHQIGCTPRYTCRRCCRWSAERHKPETCGMNRRRFPSESASRHQKEKQKPPKQKQNLKQAACAIAMQLCSAGAGWQSRRARSRFAHLMLDAGFWPTGQHNRPHHVTPATGESLQLPPLQDCRTFISRKRSFSQAFPRPHRQGRAPS